ncbi:RNA 2',3'-cyclic phosphodiesterase [Methylacidiphilum kamchatkense]|nr:RNA 2',3'-cyclic phosphodiesterase [Methylacidiphilum kamchatkense]
MNLSTDFKEEEKKERFFFAFWPDENLQSLLSKLAKDLFPKIEGRAIPQDSLHVTVLFLGWHLPSLMDEITKQIPSFLKPEGFPLSLYFDKAVFKKKGKEGIIWFEATLVPLALEKLIKKLIQLMIDNKVSFQAYDKFIPHITVFRHVSNKSVPSNMKKNQTIALPTPFELTIEALHLVRSELKPSGSHYTKIWSYSLKPE